MLKLFNTNRSFYDCEVGTLWLTNHCMALIKGQYNWTLLLADEIVFLPSTH